jgi:hypothetical protein
MSSSLALVAPVILTRHRHLSVRAVQLVLNSTVTFFFRIYSRILLLILGELGFGEFLEPSRIGEA